MRFGPNLTSRTKLGPYAPHSGQNVPKLIQAIHNLAFSSIFTRDWNKLYTLGYIRCWGCGGLGQNVPIGQTKFLPCRDDISPHCIGNVQFLATHPSSVAFGTLGHYVSKFPNFHKRLPLHLRCDWPINILKNMHTFAKIRTLVKHVHELLHYQSTKIWTQNPSQKGDIRTKLRRGIIATTLCKLIARLREWTSSQAKWIDYNCVPGKLTKIRKCPRLKGQQGLLSRPLFCCPNFSMSRKFGIVPAFANNVPQQGPSVPN